MDTIPPGLATLRPHSVSLRDLSSSTSAAKMDCFSRFTNARCALFARYLDAPAEVRQAGFFSVLRYWLVRTEHLVHEDWIPYRISLLGNYGTDLVLKREINRFLVSEDPYGTVNFVRFGLERHELRDDLDIEMMVSIIDWMVERFQDALLTAELDPGLFRLQGELSEKKDARIQQFLSVLQRAIGTPRAIAGTMRPKLRANYRR